MWGPNRVDQYGLLLLDQIGVLAGAAPGDVIVAVESLQLPIHVTDLIKNAASRKLGRKDIIKIDADLPINLDVIGYVDPQATVNIIRDGALAEKRIIGKPLRLTNVLRCKNPRCITSVEQELPHVFCLTDAENGVYRCLYCETKGTAPDGK